jgi:hypothetical protein
VTYRKFARDVATMIDIAMSNDPWFVDLNGSGSINLDAQAAKRDRFYQKIVDIGHAIQSGSHHVLSPPIIPQISAPTYTQPVSLSQFPALTSKPIASIAGNSAKRLARDTTGGVAKAELRAKRRRIEATLQSELSGQRTWRYKKGADEDMEGPEPELDVADILARAHILVPPVSGLYAQKSPSSESFDENDYYSSQANSLASSPQRRADDVDAESVAMAISSEGEISEGEFEPELDPKASTVQRPVTPDSRDLDDVVYEPEFMEEEEEQDEEDGDDDDYEPPAVDSPPYEPNPVNHPPRQLINAFAGPPLAPRAISINHIRSPVAPQPSHISPLTTVTFAQQLDHSAEQSSKSDHDVVIMPKKKGKAKNRKTQGVSPRGNQNNNQNGTAKKRKRGLEQENKLGKNKRRSQADGEPFIKEEPISPPPLPRANFGMRPPQTYPDHGNGIYDGMPRPASRAATEYQQPFMPPPGFKLVPIDIDHSAPAQPRYREAALPASRQFGRPILRDERGNEYYAYPPESPSTYQQVSYRDGLAYSERQAQVEPRAMYPVPAEQRFDEDQFRRARPTPGPPLRRHTEHTGSFNPEYRPFDERFHAPPQPSVAPYDHQNYIPTPAPMEHRAPQYGYSSADSVHSGPYAPDGHRQPPQQVAPVYGSFEPSRPHSVHPQAYVDAYHPSSSLQHGTQPMVTRAASVYPARNLSGPLPPQHTRYGDGYESAMNDSRRRY